MRFVPGPTLAGLLERRGGFFPPSKGRVRPPGVILYRMVTGETPFQGSNLEVLAQAQFADPRPPSAVRPGLDALCLRAMAKKPADRLPSATAFASALAEYIRAAGDAGRGQQEEEAHHKAGAPAAKPLDPARPRKAGEKVTLKLPGDLQMAFAWCPPGTFRMGSSHKKGFDSEKTVHRVTLTKGFYVGIHPVTQAQWKAVMGTDPSHFKGPNRPVECVSWDDCREFCEKLTAHLQGRVTVRLPTEAEWEYACRAGTTTEFHFGDVINTDLGNYDGNYQWNGSPKGEYRKETTDVGSFPANTWGLFDMHGNVWEWCEDRYGPYTGGGQSDPVNLNKQSVARVVRGGSWNGDPGYCRSAYRDWHRPGYRNYYVGVRVCFRLA